MGAQKSKPMREAPVRYIAKQMPKVDKRPMELQFKKPEFTQQGINRREDDVNTEPLMYVETAKDASSTELTDHVAPRWYLNTYLEMMDNTREERVIISGNFPLSWDRDKFEPYSLVRGRIDEEDLDWVLSPEARKMPMDELVQHTKLERDVLQDILDTVEAPRTQYRNYKGKLHKTIDDANEHMKHRKVQIEKAREAEVLRSIGYSEEDVAKEEQYITNRSRGVKTLDDLGASLRSKKRQERVMQQDEMEKMLEERRIDQIEAGTYQPTAEEVFERPAELESKVHPMKIRKQVHKNLYRADSNKDDRNMAKVQWWLDRTRRIRRGKDTIHGVPIYNERLAANDAQTRDQMRQAAEFNFSLARSQGAKGFTDPRGNYDDMMKIMRDSKDSYNVSQVEVHEDGAGERDVHRFPHTASHPPTPKVDIPKAPSAEDEQQAGAPSGKRTYDNDFEEFFANLRKSAPPSRDSDGAANAAAAAAAGKRPTETEQKKGLSTDDDRK